jgi:hypothetical protein
MRLKVLLDFNYLFILFYLILFILFYFIYLFIYVFIYLFLSYHFILWWLIFDYLSENVRVSWIIQSQRDLLCQCVPTMPITWHLFATDWRYSHSLLSNFCCYLIPFCIYLIISIFIFLSNYYVLLICLRLFSILNSLDPRRRSNTRDARHVRYNRWDLIHVNRCVFRSHYCIIILLISSNCLTSDFIVYLFVDLYLWVLFVYFFIYWY